MSTLTIRNLDSATHQGLRLRAAAHGRSVEAEVRAILDDATRPQRRGNIALAFRDLALAEGGIDLDLPPRTIDDDHRAVELD